MFSRVGKMSNIRSRVNIANHKFTSQSNSSRKRVEQRERTAEAWFPARVTDEPTEEEEVPSKRKRIAASDKGKQVQSQAVIPHQGAFPAEEGLFQLPKVWSQSNHFGPQASLYLGDFELKAIRDLGPAGRSRAVTEGVISAMRALEVTVFLNNSSTEESVRSDAFARERGEMANKMARMEAELAAVKEASYRKDNMISSLKKKGELVTRYSDELKEARAQFAAEKRALEDALHDTSLPSEDETENTAELARPALVYQIEELERNLVGVARHGFANVIDQLQVVNLGVHFQVEGIDFLKYVRNGKIVAQDDEGHVGNAQVYVAL